MVNFKFSLFNNSSLASYNTQYHKTCFTENKILYTLFQLRDEVNKLYIKLPNLHLFTYSIRLCITLTSINHIYSCSECPK